MSQIMKCYTGLFVILLMTAAASGILAIFLQVLSSQNLQADIVYRLESSDFSRTVIEECFQDAEDREDTLTLTFYMEDGSSVKCTGTGKIPKDTSKIQSAKVALAFSLKNDFPAINEKHVFVGYAW